MMAVELDPGRLLQRVSMATAQTGQAKAGGGGRRVSEVAGAGVAVVVELLFDVHHVLTGVLQLPQLHTSAQISQITKAGEPRPGQGVCERYRAGEVGTVSHAAHLQPPTSSLHRYIPSASPCSSHLPLFRTRSPFCSYHPISVTLRMFSLLYIACEHSMRVCMCV